MSIMFRKCASSSTKPALHSRQAGMVIRGTVERGLEDGYSARGTTDMILSRCPAFGATGTADVAARMFHNRATRVIRLMHKIEVYAPEGPANCAYVIQRGIV